MAKIVKPNATRGQIFDKLAETFGDSVLGMYEGKLRIEIVNDDGEVIQFSLAPVIHKTLVEETECDKLVPIAEQVAAYEAASAAKTAENDKKKNDKKTDKKNDKKADKKTSTEGDVTPQEDIVASSEGSVELTEEEQAKLDELAKALEMGEF